MARLFILGNGFDLAHGYKTKYSDLKEWMKKNTVGFDPESFCPEIPGSSIGSHGEEYFNDDELYKMLLWLLINNPVMDDEWNEFEKSLGELNLGEVISEWTEEYNEDNDRNDNEYFRTEYRFEDNASALSSAVIKISEVFKDWINTVQLPKKVIPFGENIIMCGGYAPYKSDMFLSFNYTETLEQNYNVPSSQVCHIHGYRKADEDLIIGHNNDGDKDYLEDHPTANDYLNDCHSALKKKQNKNIIRHQSFFEAIDENILDIYSFGFSFSDVDLPYIEKIVERVGKTEKVTWHLNSYNEKDNEDYMKCIKKCGFNGQFAEY